MQMTFGSFKGTDVSKLPSWYLDWLSTITIKNARLARAIEAVRSGARPPDEDKDKQIAELRRHLYEAELKLTIVQDRSITRETMSKIMRAYLAKYHPDCGGSDEIMRVVNAIHGDLKSALGT